VNEIHAAVEHDFSTCEYKCESAHSSI